MGFMSQVPRPIAPDAAWFTGVPRPCRHRDRRTEGPAARRMIPRVAPFDEGAMWLTPAMRLF